MLLECLLAVLTLPVQEPASDPKIALKLEQLLTKSDAYEHFVVRYVVREKSGATSGLRIAFRAPNHVRITTESSKSLDDEFINGSSMESRFKETGKPQVTASATNWDAGPRSRTLVLQGIDHEFPNKLHTTERATSPNLAFQFMMEEDDHGFGIGTSWSNRGMLQWLCKPDEGIVEHSAFESDGNLIALSGWDGVRLLISVDTGFLSRIERRTNGETRVGMELKDLDLASVPPASEFSAPAPEADAVSDTEGLEAKLAAQAYQHGRAALFRTLTVLLDDGRIEWSQETGKHVEAVLRTLAREELVAAYRPAVSKHRQFIATVEQTYSKSLASFDHSDAEQVDSVRKSAQDSRVSLEKSVSGGVLRMAKAGFPQGVCKSVPELPADLGEIEKRVLTDVHAELVAKPLFAEYDQMVTRLFRD